METKLCPACDCTYDRHPRNSAECHSCPWMMALHSVDGLTSRELEEFCNKHWREFWTPCLFDWVRFEPGGYDFQIVSIDGALPFYRRADGLSHMKNDLRPAHADEIMAARRAELVSQFKAPATMPDDVPQFRCIETLHTWPDAKESPEQTSREYFEQKMRPAGWPKPWTLGITRTIDISYDESCPCCSAIQKRMQTEKGFFPNGVSNQSLVAIAKHVCPECHGSGVQTKTVKVRI